MDDGAGGVLELKTKFPVWFDPTSSGGTPMAAAMRTAAEAVADWCDAHPSSYPPTVIHVTDGASTDGDPSAVADALGSKLNQTIEVRLQIRFKLCKELGDGK